MSDDYIIEKTDYGFVVTDPGQVAQRKSHVLSVTDNRPVRCATNDIRRPKTRGVPHPRFLRVGLEPGGPTGRSLTSLA
jgi:hypothetical protein